jgi:hypothetical protein
MRARVAADNVCVRIDMCALGFREGFNRGLPVVFRKAL